ncbi:MAG: insulinase family protein [Muribaculaceae bacterium]|nr:insulinase family protein [Muribaculaceae bacterium]
MTDRSKAPEVRELDVRPMPPETVETLPSGLRFHRFSGGDQEVCNLTFVFEGGASELGSDILSRVMLMAATEATASYDTATMADLMDFNGVRTGAVCHGHYSSLTFGILNHRLPAVLPLIGSMLTEPVFPQERLSSMLLSAKAQQATARRDIAVLADEASQRMMMGSNHPLAFVPDDAYIDSITRLDIATLHSRMMCPARMNVFLSGLIDGQSLTTVRDFLPGLPSLGSGVEKAVVPFTSAPAGTRVEVRHNESLQSAIVCSMPAIERTHPDYNDLRLAVIALGGYFGSRLMSNIREEKGLTYGIGASLLGSQEGSLIKISARCDKSYTERVLTEIASELRLLATAPPEGAELDRLRRHVLTSLAQQLDTPTSIMGYYATELYVGTPPRYFEAQQEAARALTPERIAQIASTYLRPEFLRTAIAL